MAEEKEDIKRARQDAKRPSEKAAGKAADSGLKLEKDEILERMKQSSAKPSTPPSQAVHTVVSGDTLSGIAQQYYGSSGNWKIIYEANKETIGDNPNVIRVGQVLNIPSQD